MFANIVFWALPVCCDSVYSALIFGVARKISSMPMDCQTLCLPRCTCLSSFCGVRFLGGDSLERGHASLMQDELGVGNLQWLLSTRSSLPMPNSHRLFPSGEMLSVTWIFVLHARNAGLTQARMCRRPSLALRGAVMTRPPATPHGELALVW